MSLLRQPKREDAFPALERVAQRFARGLKDYVATIEPSEPTIQKVPCALAAYGEWKSGRTSDIGFQFHLHKKLSALVVIPAPMMLGMFDLFFGGTGALAVTNTELTASELRFADRLAEQMRGILAKAWAETLPMKPVLSAIASSPSAAPLFAASETVLVQDFRLVNSVLAGGSITCLYSQAALRSEIAHQDDNALAVPQSDDDEWSARMNAVALGVRFPVRTIFARPEISVAKLLTLQPGDIIPVLLPQHVPITVAGRHFAKGNIGEANGRAAIKIEKMNEGFAP